MTITRQTLANEYNTLARAMGEKELGLAKDMKQAQARLDAIQARCAKFTEEALPKASKAAPKAKIEKAPKPDNDVAAPKVKRQKKGRGLDFNYPAGPEQKVPQKGSMRDKCLQMMLVGTTFEKVEALVRAEGKDNLATLRYRTMRLIEAISISVGYGITHDRSDNPDTGLIKAFC